MELETKVSELVRLINENEAREYWIDMQRISIQVRRSYNPVHPYAQVIRSHDLFAWVLIYVHDHMRFRWGCIQDPPVVGWDLYYKLKTIDNCI